MKDFDYYLFTDGASSGNPGPGGFGGVLILKKGSDFVVEEYAGGEKNTTNNKMEIQAMIAGLEKTLENSKILIFSDSTYAIKGITIWIKKWKNNGWLTSLKKPVENKGLWQKLDELVSNRNVSFKYVPGHRAISLNERADKLAVVFYEGQKPKLFKGLKKNYKIEFKFEDFDKEFPKEEGSSNQGKAFSYVSLINGKFKVHKTWAECEKEVKGKKARYKKVFSQEEENEIRTNWINN